MDTPETEFEQLSRPGEGALRLIVGLHWVESAAQVFGLLVLRYVSGLALPYGPLWVVILVFVAWNFWSAWLVRRGVVYPERQVAVQLMAEVLVLAGLLYFTGGATNPFVSLFLVPLAIGAMTIRFSIALAIAMA
ncbi:MAG: hypothetical protein KDI19_07440, partial [Pseudomonadales bacterium]|nr:hypothetical protein [Pseudomonadales bacterium]